MKKSVFLGFLLIIISFIQFNFLFAFQGGYYGFAESYVLENGEPFNCHYRGSPTPTRFSCGYRGNVTLEWGKVGNFTMSFEGLFIPSWLDNSSLTRLFSTGAFGEINFSIYDNNYTGVLYGTTIKDFTFLNVSGNISHYLIVERSKLDPIFMDKGSPYHIFIIKNNEEVIEGNLKFDSKYNKGFPIEYQTWGTLHLSKDIIESRLSLFDNEILQTKNQINICLNNITILTQKIIILDQRLKVIENKTSQNNSQFNSPYFKYLSSSDRKNIICGYAEDNRLTSYEDLGWHCDITYSVSRTGRESVRCKCYKIS